MNLHATISALEGHLQDVREIPSAPRQSAQSELEALIELEDPINPVLEHMGIEYKLKQFVFRERQHSSSDILNYWKMRQYAEPELYKLAEAVLSIPSTQVSVERAFSSLPLILKKNRLSLSSVSLSNILMVRLNYDKIEEVDFV